MRKITTEIAIVILLWIYVVSSMIFNPHFGVQFIFGIISITFVSTTLLLKKEDLSRGILVLSLLLSTFNVVKFSDAFDVRIGIFHLIPLILLFVLIFTKLSQLISLREKWFGDEPAELEKAKENKIAIYKREFQNLSLEELINRKNNYQLVEEAKIAINQILKERNVTIDA